MEDRSIPQPPRTGNNPAKPALGRLVQKGGNEFRLLPFLLPAIVLLAAFSSWAADQPTDPNAEFLRRQQRELELRRQQEQTPDVRLQAKPGEEEELLPEGESPCMYIERIELTGDEADRFQWALAAADRTTLGRRDPVRSHCLGTTGINRVMGRIQNAIIDRGFITTRVLAGPQDLATGTLRLTVVPGRIRAIRLAEGTSRKATLFNALPAATGDLLNLRDIEQGLENLKRVPTAEADIRITPAEGADARPGESDLVVAWQQKFPLRVTLSVDDSGTRGTGRYLGNATLSWDDMLALNDLFYINLNHDLMGDAGDKGTGGGTVHYSLPHGYWLFGANASRSEYHQTVAGANQSYRYSGRSSSTSINISRLILRDAIHKTTLSLGGWLRTSKNFIDDTEIEVQRRRMAGWEAGISERIFFGRATVDLRLGYRRGTGALDSLPAPEEVFGEGTSRPEIVIADARLTLPFAVGSQQLSYHGEFRGQWNQTPLVVLDRFSIGGRYTVRGFDGENTLLADRGWITRNDLGWQLGSSGQELYFALDHGEVGGQSSGLLVGKRLTGAALGLRGQYRGAAYDLFIGVPLGKPEGFDTTEPTTGFMASWTL